MESESPDEMGAVRVAGDPAADGAVESGSPGPGMDLRTAGGARHRASAWSHEEYAPAPDTPAPDTPAPDTPTVLDGREVPSIALSMSPDVNADDMNSARTQSSLQGVSQFQGMSRSERSQDICFNYLKKMQGVTGKRGPPLITCSRDHAWSAVGCFCGIAMLAALQYNYPDLSNSNLAMLVASFGASAILVYGAPAAPLAQPRNVIVGQVLSALVGVATRKLILEGACDGADSCTWLAAALSVSLAMFVMAVTGTIHPPGGATALLGVIGDAHLRGLGFLYAIVPAGVGSVMMVIVGLILNNTSPDRQYPQYWW